MSSNSQRTVTYSLVLTIIMCTLLAGSLLIGFLAKDNESSKSNTTQTTVTTSPPTTNTTRQEPEPKHETTTTTDAPPTTVTTLAPRPTVPNTASNIPTTSIPYVADTAFLECVKNRESRGNYSVVNPSSGAGGAYQFLPSTWAAAGFADKYGVARAEYATPEQQDEAANILYANGAGASHWAGPGC